MSRWARQPRLATYPILHHRTLVAAGFLPVELDGTICRTSTAGPPKGQVQCTGSQRINQDSTHAPGCLDALVLAIGTLATVLLGTLVPAKLSTDLACPSTVHPAHDGTTVIKRCQHRVRTMHSRRLGRPSSSGASRPGRTGLAPRQQVETVHRDHEAPLTHDSGPRPRAPSPHSCLIFLIFLPGPISESVVAPHNNAFIVPTLAHDRPGERVDVQLASPAASLVSEPEWCRRSIPCR